MKTYIKIFLKVKNIYMKTNRGNLSRRRPLLTESSVSMAPIWLSFCFIKDIKFMGIIRRTTLFNTYIKSIFIIDANINKKYEIEKVKNLFA